MKTTNEGGAFREPAHGSESVGLGRIGILLPTWRIVCTEGHGLKAKGCSAGTVTLLIIRTRMDW